MCSAAATLGFTTSQFAITRVLGTLPSVYQQKQKSLFSQKKNTPPPLYSNQPQNPTHA